MSKYREKIQTGIEQAGASNVVLIGSTLLVEVVRRERKTQSGIYLGEKAEGKELTECVVVATGAGYYDEEEGDKPLDTKVGDIIYAEPMNVRLLYSFPVAGYSPHDIGLLDESQILMRFRGEAAVSAFRKGAGLNE